MGYRIENNFLRTVKIEQVVEESSQVKTFFFLDELCSRSEPGQFIMVWLPGLDEIPMSISSTNHEGIASITAAKIGKATSHLLGKVQGDIVGIRGPFGNSFKPVKGEVLLVAGGTGSAPLAFLAEKLVERKIKLSFLLGAETMEGLLFSSRLKRLFSETESKMLVSTEDGSLGHKGLITELVKETLVKNKIDMIYACGKELMLLKLFELAEKHKVPLQASLERLMRCAIGLCGSCSIGKYRVCIDGPVFTTPQLREIKAAFGQFKRDFDGRKIPV